jgi:IS30 family transposase
LENGRLENFNGLRRQYFKKWEKLGDSLVDIQVKIKAAVEMLNNRPRKK